jgi:hypothetical protein
VRKFLPLIIILLVLFPSCAATLSLPEPNQESDTFSWWLHNLKSPEQLQALLEDCTYISDLEQFGRTEYFQTPDEFFRNRKGDCEDFAYFSAYVFLRKRWAFKAWVVLVALRYNKGVHAVAVVKSEIGYIAIDYAHISEPFSTLEDAVEITVSPYSYSYVLKILEVKLPEKASTKSIEGHFCPLWGCE